MRRLPLSLFAPVHALSSPSLSSPSLAPSQLNLLRSLNPRPPSFDADADKLSSLLAADQRSIDAALRRRSFIRWCVWEEVRWAWRCSASPFLFVPLPLSALRPLEPLGRTVTADAALTRRPQRASSTSRCATTLRTRRRTRAGSPSSGARSPRRSDRSCALETRRGGRPRVQLQYCYAMSYHNDVQLEGEKQRERAGQVERQQGVRGSTSSDTVVQVGNVGCEGGEDRDKDEGEACRARERLCEQDAAKEEEVGRENAPVSQLSQLSARSSAASLSLNWRCSSSSCVALESASQLEVVGKGEGESRARRTVRRARSTLPMLLSSTASLSLTRPCDSPTAVRACATWGPAALRRAAS